MKKIIIYFCIAAIFLFVGTTIIFARSSSTNYVIWGDVFSIGGLESGSSASYKIQDTLGEALAWSATTTSASYGAKAGFRELYWDQYITLSLGATSVNFGTANYQESHTATHTLMIDTNAVKGFNLTVSGNTLTKGSDTITAIGSTAQPYSYNTEQFGINLVDNSSPDIGANPSGTSPIGSASSPFGTANYFAFNDTTTNTIASASTDVNLTTYTVSYLLSTAVTTQTGNYSTTLTYAATANF